jgi:voltage-dependent calcium channel L type alpha-1D
MKPNLAIWCEILNNIFSLIFNIEMVLKLIGLGYFYFWQYWNLFDFFVVVTTDLGVLLDVLGVEGSYSSTATVFRAFRMMKMFRLIKSSENVKLLLDTVFNILPSVTNIMALMVLLLYIYAALALNLFSGVMLQKHLSEEINF